MNNPFDPGYYTEGDLREFGFKSLGKNVRIAKNCTIVHLETISIASHVRIDSGATIISGKGGITLGNYVHIAAGCYLGGRYGICLEDFAGLSQGVKIYSQSDDYAGGTFTNPTVPKEYTKVLTGGVLLEKHVIIGAGSIVLPNCTLAVGCSVGALSVIRTSTQSWKVYWGNPARVIADRSRIDPDGAIEKILLKRH